MKATLPRVCLLLAMVVGYNAISQAQSSPDTRNELWPEIDVFVPLNEKFRLFFLGTVTKARETRASFEGQVGAHVDYLYSKHLTFRAGYRYGFSIDSDDPFKEHRVIVQETIQKPLPRKIILTDRIRQDLRWVNGDFSMRFRNRVTLEREFHINKRGLVPYGSAEIFYDTRFSTFNRYRFAVGTQFVFKKREYWFTHIRRQQVLDFYYLRQNDTRSEPKHVNAIGTTYSITF